MMDASERLRLQLLVGLGAVAMLVVVAAILVMGNDDGVSTDAAPILPGDSFVAGASNTQATGEGAGDPAAPSAVDADSTAGTEAAAGAPSTDPATTDDAMADDAMAEAEERQPIVVGGAEASTVATAPSTTSTTVAPTTAPTAPASTATSAAPTTSTTAAPTTAAPSTAAPTTATPATAVPPTAAPTTAAPTTAAPTTAAPTTAAPTTAPPTTQASDVGTSGDRDLERQVIDLTNQRRADNGCPPLANNNRLHAAALGHSVDMANNDYFSHTSLDGSSMSDRIDRQGYSWRRLAENIAAGYPTPQAVVEGWMNSPGHRANILNCDLTEIGVGHHQRYWTQNFGTPR